MDTPTPSTPRTSPFFHPLPLIDTLTLASYDSPTTPTTSRPATSGHVTPTYAEPSSFYYQRNPGDFPPEIVSLIVHHLYDTLLPPLCEYPSPDPYLQLLPKPTPYSSPLFAPSPAEQARESFRNLALVDRTWGEEATKALWRVVGFGMPRAFENVLRTIEEYKSGRRIKRAERVDVSGSSGWSFDTIGGMDERGRGMEVGGDNKWSAMAGREIVGQEIPIASPTLESLQAPPSLEPEHSPLLHTKVLSFSRFRTAGLRRSVRQGSHERFVTPHRLLALLRGTRLTQGPLSFPGAEEDEEDSIASLFTDDEDVNIGAKGRLEAVGFTEFMDSAISKGVIDELLFRGGYLAEYEEPEDVHMDLTEEPRPTIPPPSPAFLARHLQSSSSRSPSSRHRPTLSTNPEEDSADESDSSQRGRPTPSSHRLERRGSGSAFAPPQSASGRDGSEERGRDRTGRDRDGTAGATRGRPSLKRNRSLAPPSAFLARSSSVPAVYLHRARSLGSERSSSVPASIRRGRGATRIVRVLEGSTDVRAIRALDLCGCVSSVFVQSLEQCIATYRLGPPGSIVAVAATAITTISEGGYDSMEDDGSGTEGGTSFTHSYSIGSDSHDDDDEGRKLKRIFFPHLRRLGLASSLLPAALLTAFVLSFPYLTHLDLTSTLTSPMLLKHLALSGQNGPGGRSMRLKALSLARCRLVTGESIVGLLCGDCPPFTSMAGIGGEEEESWGGGEVVSDLVDLSLYGDGTYPSPLSLAELRLVLTISPAFTSGHLRTLDLSSTPLTDALLADHFPPQPHLIELGLANCRNISIRGVAKFLEEKAPGVEILDLSNSCPPPIVPLVGTQRRGIASTSLSIMELHTQLLGRVASVRESSSDPQEAIELLVRRSTNLRVVELDTKALEGVQGGAGDWKPIWGKGRRGWYVDIGVSSGPLRDPTIYRRPRQLVHLPRDSAKRMALQRLADLNGVVSGEIGWHARKMEVLRGDGMMGREDGLFAFFAYQV